MNRVGFEKTHIPAPYQGEFNREKIYKKKEIRKELTGKKLLKKRLE